MKSLFPATHSPRTRSTFSCLDKLMSWASRRNRSMPARGTAAAPSARTGHRKERALTSVDVDLFDGARLGQGRPDGAVDDGRGAKADGLLEDVIVCLAGEHGPVTALELELGS